MKTLRYFAALLMLLTGILHVLPKFEIPRVPDALPMLVFGIAYFTVGVLLIVNKKIATTLGIVFPLTGLVVGFLVVGLRNWDTILSIMFLIDAVVIICCIILMFRNRTIGHTLN